jgi:tRNA-2-methylthio-N6-dimethylallyladenosine synthase
MPTKTQGRNRLPYSDLAHSKVTTMKKLYIRTFGCQMNEYDSQKMTDVLKHSHALELTDDALEADVLLINTCSIREICNIE